jgi:hypothetical protein
MYSIQYVVLFINPDLNGYSWQRGPKKAPSHSHRPDEPGGGGILIVRTNPEGAGKAAAPWRIDAVPIGPGPIEKAVLRQTEKQGL